MSILGFWKRSSSLERNGRRFKSMSWPGLRRKLARMHRSSSTNLKSENKRLVTFLIQWTWTTWKSIISCLIWKMKIQEPATLQHREGLKHSQKLKSKRLAFCWRRNSTESNQMKEDKSSLMHKMEPSERTWMNSWSWQTRIAPICLWCHKQDVLHNALNERGKPIWIWIMPYSTRMDILRVTAKRTSRTLQNLKKLNLVRSWTQILIIQTTKSRGTNYCRKEPFSNLQCL